jgi:lipopolysaccharide heptosyltransferase II
MTILVRLPNWLGDLVMSGAFVRACAEFYGGPVDVIVKRELAPLAPLLGPVGEVVPFGREDARSLRRWVRLHRVAAGGRRYDRFFCLPDSFSSALGAFASRSRHRIGYAHEGRSLLLTHAYPKPPGVHRVLEYRNLLDAYAGADGVPPPRVVLGGEALERARSPLAGPAAARPLILFNPNSAAQSRRLPPGKAAALADRLLEEFAGTLAIPGSGSERVFSEEVRRRTRRPERCVNLAGKTDGLALAALCRSADLVVSTDSGIAHLAAALGRPVAVLFGAGDPAGTAPFTEAPLEVVRAPGVDCSPCVVNRCAHAEPPCLTGIGEEQVLAACRSLLGRQLRGPDHSGGF